MTRFPGFILLASALVLAACATALPTPEQYGFRREALNGKEYFCAPPQYVIPPVAPALFVPAADLSGDTPSGIFGTTYPNTHEVCLTPAQWPKWLTMRNQLDQQWPITPGTAGSLASH